MSRLLALFVLAAGLAAAEDYATLRVQADAAASRRDYDGARALLRQAIDARIATDGRFSATLIPDYFSLALLYRPGNQQQEGLRALDRATEIVMRGSPMDSVALADIHSMRGILLLTMKEQLAAVSVLNTAITLREGITGPEHGSLLPDLDRLAGVQMALRDYAAAEAAARRAIRIRERLLGPEDADLLGMLDVLAYSLYGQQKYEEGELVYQRLIRLWESSAGSHHPMLALALEKLSALYLSWEKPELSAEAAARATALRRHFLAAGLFRQAALEIKAKRLAEGLRLLREARSVLKPAHPATEELLRDIEEQIKLVQPAVKPAPAKKPAKQ